jgi:hypothetical protein
MLVMGYIHQFRVKLMIKFVFWDMIVWFMMVKGYDDKLRVKTPTKKLTLKSSIGMTCE